MRALKASGYQVSARLMNAMYFHVPQSRARMIFVGIRADIDIQPSLPSAQASPISTVNAIGYLEGRFPLELSRHRPHIYEQWKTGYHPRYGRAGLRVVRASAYVGSFNSCRLEYDKPAPTFVKVHNHWHYKEFRQLSKIEVALLASYPLSFEWSGDFIARIGNSVPPLFMRAIATHLAQLLRQGSTPSHEIVPNP
jgi:DNA (cytosine-5)-methyltransferase 1